MADLNISLEEYDTLRNELDKYKTEVNTWQKYCQDLAAGKLAAITRYDRHIDPQVIRRWSEEVWLTIRDRLDAKYRSYNYGVGGSLRDGICYDTNSSIFDDEKIASHIIEEELVKFVTKFCNTENRDNINVSTKYINADEIINSVKHIYDERFKQEYDVKVKETNQKHIEAKKLKRQAEEQLANLESKFEEDIIQKDYEIRQLTGDKERALERVDQLTSMLAESDKKYLQESMENTGLKDTIHNQKEKIDIIKSLQTTWWWKMFGPKIEF